MKTPRLRLAAVPLLLACLLLAALPAVVASCGGRSPDTTLAPPVAQVTTVTGGGGVLRTTTTEPPASPTAADNILFRDDFQDGDTEGWQVDGAWVVQQDGDLYTFTATGAGYANVPKGVSWDGDYAFKCSYQLDAGTLAFSFDATNDGRYYVSVGPDLISLLKEDAADNKTVLTQAQAPASGQQHYLVIAKKNGALQVYVDKILYLSFQDDAPLAAGTIVVGSTAGTTAWVDDVLVNKIARALPQGAPAMEPVDPSQVVAPPDAGVDLDQLPESDQDVPDLPAENLPEAIPVPAVTFTGRVNDEGGAAASHELTVVPGTVVVLEWQTTDASRVFLNGTPYPVDSSLSAVIRESVAYELEVLGWDDQSYSHYVQVTVTGGDDAGAHGPDLAINVLPMTVDAGTTDVHVSVELRNQGDQDATGITFRWYAHEQNGEVNKTAVYDIPAGETISLGFAYHYAQRGNMHWLATVDEEEQVPDVDRSNNAVRGTVDIP